MPADQIEALNRRIAALEDEREIRYVLSRYAHYSDFGFEDEWVGQWTDDGVYDIVTVSRDGSGYDGAITFEGREDLYRLIRDPAAHKAFEGRSMHLQDMNLLIAVDGDAATAQGYVLTILTDHDTNEVHIRSGGSVRWDFVRIDGRWRIARKSRRKIGDRSNFHDAATVTAHLAAHSA